jgi:hypothetical protein
LIPEPARNRAGFPSFGVRLCVEEEQKENPIAMSVAMNFAPFSRSLENQALRCFHDPQKYPPREPFIFKPSDVAMKPWNIFYPLPGSSLFSRGLAVAIIFTIPEVI